MHFSMLNVILFAAVVACWSALGWYSFLSERRRSRQQAEWTRAAAAMSGLDAELDRVWAAENERIKRLL